MRIIKYQKYRKNTYLIKTSEEDLILYDDIIIKNELLLRNKITKEEIEKIKKENEALDCYYRGLDYLGRKMRSKKEVEDYLKKTYSKKDIDETIKLLEKEGYLNDFKYIEAYLNDALKFSNDGPLKIKNKLINLGIKEEVIDDYLKNISSLVWIKKCEKLLEKKLNSYHKDSRNTKILKAKNYLITCGYPSFLINDVIGNLEVKINPLGVKKEYQKIKEKLSKKYDSNKLDFYVKMKMKQKGYSDDEINFL